MTRPTLDIPSQRGRTAIVTGTGGLGFEVAGRLAAAGAAVTIAGRNPARGAEAVAGMKATVPGAIVAFEALDLADLASITAFAARLTDRGEGVDILVNNAGVMSPPQRRTTADGFELQFGVNHLGHFALTGRLLPLLLARPGARIVSVTSMAQHHGRIDFDDLQGERRYRPGLAYCQSKLAQAVFAIELQRRIERAGGAIASNAAHPGLAGTALFANGVGETSLTGVLSRYLFVPLLGQTPSEGALPLLYAATSPHATGGTLYGPTGLFRMKGAPGLDRFAEKARSPELGARLWEVSEQLAGVHFDLPPAPAPAIAGAQAR